MRGIAIDFFHNFAAFFSKIAMPNSPTLLVLAAGIGSRYGGIKQLDGIGPGGTTILEYSVYDALRSGFGRVVFIIRRAIEADFRQLVLAKLPAKLPVQLAYQELEALPTGIELPAGRVKPWGTAHAVWCAKDAIDSPFAVINADDFYGLPAFQALGGYLARTTGAGAWSMVGYPLASTLSEAGTVSRGVCRLDAQGQLQGIREYTKIRKTAEGIVDEADAGNCVVLPEDSVVSMNCWGFTPDYIQRAEEYIREFFRGSADTQKAECYIPTVVERSLAAGLARCQVLPCRSPWCGVTYPADRPYVAAQLAGLVEQGVYPEHLWKS